MVTSTNMSFAVLPSMRKKPSEEWRIASDTARFAALVASLPWTSMPMPISVIQRIRAIGFPVWCLFGSLGAWNTVLDIELQDVAEAVEGAAQCDPPGQLDDLGFGEMRTQPAEDLVACPCPVVVHGNGVLDDQPVHLIEFGVIPKIEQPLDAL